LFDESAPRRRPCAYATAHQPQDVGPVGYRDPRNIWPEAGRRQVLAPPTVAACSPSAARACLNAIHERESIFRVTSLLTMQNARPFASSVGGGIGDGQCHARGKNRIAFHCWSQPYPHVGGASMNAECVPLKKFRMRDECHWPIDRFAQ
jgi:hypothetical protein